MPSVLICDDARFMRTVIGQVLGQYGFTVVGEADSGPRAVERYFALRPDLVTMDIVMPELDGIAAIRQIMERDPTARIVVCTAVGQDKHVAESVAAGAKAFLVKPFKPAQLMDAVDRALATNPR
jgi:two-component system chemotaxis response regulator CheY